MGFFLYLGEKEFVGHLLEGTLKDLLEVLISA